MLWRTSLLPPPLPLLAMELKVVVQGSSGTWPLRLVARLPCRPRAAAYMHEGMRAAVVQAQVFGLSSTLTPGMPQSRLVWKAAWGGPAPGDMPQVHPWQVGSCRC